MLKLSIIFTLLAALQLTAAGAEAGMCGIKGNTPAQIEAGAKHSNFKLAVSNTLFVSYFNKAKVSTLTFTKPAHGAHPAVACRRAVKKNKAWVVMTQLNCGGPKRACDALAREFAELDEQMKQALQKTP